VVSTYPLNIAFMCRSVECRYPECSGTIISINLAFLAFLGLML
jgi:hypothetical protein